ncbi:uncharacterized protein LOC129872279 [Solanum dulcamara]|uniref:uncharacterized protein LOC129872279 n=1 Tax=Solanum dulcamara TaxID=45834 RepID=UPI002486B4D4|nr:uncharacterized protein LOC129872279 [Solanum dulcamara]
MAQENVKFLLGVWLLLLYFFSSVFGDNNTQDGNYGDGSISPPTQSACTNCTICPYTCQPPPLQPPPTPPSDGGYQSYGVPPPAGYENCPPAQPVTPCCPQYNNYGPPPPPYNYYSGSSTLLPFIKLFAFEWSSAILVLFLHYVVCG